MKTCKKCNGTEFNSDGRCTPCRKEVMKKARAKWISDNPEKAKLAQIKYYKNNTEKIKETKRKYHEANPHIAKKSNDAYLKRNPDYRRIKDHNKRARIKANGGKLTIGISDRLYKMQKGKCACCGKPLENDYHLDHIMPSFLGGKNEDYNIQLLRAECNLQKSAKHPVDFMQSKGFLL